MTNTAEVRVDVGEIEVALNSIIGAAEGLVSKRATRHIGKTFARLGQKFFYLHADQHPNLDHVYEWGEQGPGTRLYHIRWDHGPTTATGRVTWLESLKEIPMSEAKKRKEAELGRMVFRRYEFPDKAVVLETVPMIEQRAGERKYTKVVGGPAQVGGREKPTYLVYTDSSGRLKFTKSLTRRNPNYGKFEAFWDTYWADHAKSIVVLPISSTWQLVAGVSAPREIQKAVTAAAPKAAAGANTKSKTPVTVFGASRPMKVRTSPSMRNKVLKRLKKELDRT